jgi:diamine N-acetyltransferase
MKNNFTIRLATTSDIPTIFALAKKIWYDHYISIITIEQIDYMMQWMYSETSLTEQMNEKGHRFFIISSDDVPLGFMAISGAENNCFIHKFYVLTDQQRSGVGTFFFNEILKEFNAPKEIRLTVNRKNFKAINFYFKMGFVIEKVEEFQIGNGYEMNDFVMVWHS